jgi:hypothetical protein
MIHRKDSPQDYPPYDFLLVTSYIPKVYPMFREILDKYPRMRLLRIGRPEYGEFEHINKNNVRNNVYIVQEPEESDLRAIHKFALYCLDGSESADFLCSIIEDFYEIERQAQTMDSG